MDIEILLLKKKGTQQRKLDIEVKVLLEVKYQEQ